MVSDKQTIKVMQMQNPKRSVNIGKLILNASRKGYICVSAHKLGIVLSVNKTLGFMHTTGRSLDDQYHFLALKAKDYPWLRRETAVIRRDITGDTSEGSLYVSLYDDVMFIASRS